MRALVLAGGAGTRLRPITHTSAKQLVPVGNKPILFYALEHMAAAGIREVGVIVGDTADEVRAAVGDGSRWGLEVTYLPQAAPLGLAHCVLIAGAFLGDEDFIMYLGDNLLRQGVRPFVEAFEASRAGTRVPTFDAPDPRPAAAQILLAHVPDAQRFGVAELGPDGAVVRLLEKPPAPPSDLALVGVYLFDRRIHEAVRAIRPSARGELEITDAIQWLLDRGHPVRHEIVDGWWKDLGELDALLEGNRVVLEGLEPRVEGRVDEGSVLQGRVVVEAGAEVVRSVIRGPAIIGRGARVADSFIGPFTSVGDGCRVVGSEIEHSIVLADSAILDIPRVADSLIGREVVVRRAGTRPAAARLMLGDHSSVELP